MARFNKTLPQTRHEGRVVYDEGIVDDIVIRSLNEVEDVELYSGHNKNKTRSKSVSVVFGKDGVSVDVCVKIKYNKCVSDVAFNVQETIRHNVENMTEFHIDSVNVVVKGVLFDEAVPVAPLEPVVSDNGASTTPTEDKNAAADNVR